MLCQIDHKDRNLNSGYMECITLTVNMDAVLSCFEINIARAV